MQTDSIRKLLAPFVQERELDDSQIAKVAHFLELLLRWNEKTNLTSIRTSEEIITRHFGEGFFMASRLCAAADAATAIDFGSGAGFPGIPLAIYAQTIRVTLIESQNKKASFLKEAARALALNNVTIFAERGESFKGTADIVTFRAVEKFEESSAAAARLVSRNGRFALLITHNQASVAKSIPGFAWAEPIKVLNSQESVLLVGSRMAAVEGAERR